LIIGKLLNADQAGTQ
jgi:hypothetical protein